MVLVSVGKGFLLEEVTARQFMLWNAVFFDEFGVDMVVNWTTRTRDEQIALLKKYYTRMTSKPKRGAKGYWWDGYWWQQRGNTIVAKPDTSRHQLGFCADVESFRWAYNARMAQFARDTARSYGFAFNVKGEDWHVDRTLRARITSGRQRPLGAASVTAPTQSSKPSAPLPQPQTPAAPIGKADEMLILHNKDMSAETPKQHRGSIIVVHGQRFEHVNDKGHAEFLETTFAPEVRKIDKYGQFVLALRHLGLDESQIPTNGEYVWVDNPRD